MKAYGMKRKNIPEAGPQVPLPYEVAG